MVFNQKDAILKFLNWIELILRTNNYTCRGHTEFFYSKFYHFNFKFTFHKPSPELLWQFKCLSLALQHRPLVIMSRGLWVLPPAVLVHTNNTKLLLHDNTFSSCTALEPASPSPKSLCSDMRECVSHPTQCLLLPGGSLAPRICVWAPLGFSERARQTTHNPFCLKKHHSQQSIHSEFSLEN